MPDLPNSSSFIPKRTTGTKIRQKRTRNFFLLSIVSYACLIAAPTASAAVYVYQMYTERQFDQTVTRLDEAISGFSEAEMARVLEFDRRLKMAEHLVDTHVSVVKAFTALEQTTVRNAGFRSLAIKRLDEGTLSVEGELLATNFDTALFQRGAYNADSVTMERADLNDISFSPATEEGDGEVVTFNGTFTFLTSDIAFTPNSVQPDTTPDAAVTSETSTSDDAAADSDDGATVTDEAI
jgi:hypothetical protein